VNNGTLQVGENGVPGSIGSGAVKVASGARFFVVDLPGSGNISGALGSNAMTNAGATTTGTIGGATHFFNTTSAGTATITTREVRLRTRSPSPTAAGLTFGMRARRATPRSSIKARPRPTRSAVVAQFSDTSTAGAAQITNQGGNFVGQHGTGAEFAGNSTAGSAAITNQAGTVAGAPGGLTEFEGSATGGSATITSLGASVSGGSGGATLFAAGSTAGSATIYANGGNNGGGGRRHLLHRRCRRRYGPGHYQRQTVLLISVD